MDATPAGFKFAIKANQRITHVKRLRAAAELAAEFISSLEPLGKAGKLGPVLFQLPPNLKRDVPLLTEFLTGVPRRLRAAFYFGDTSWFAVYVFAALRNINAALCLAESEDIRTPLVQTAATFFYLRLRKDNYSAKSLRERMQKRRADRARRGEVFAYFKHEKESPQCALRAEAMRLHRSTPVDCPLHVKRTRTHLCMTRKIRRSRDGYSFQNSERWWSFRKQFVCFRARPPGTKPAGLFKCHLGDCERPET